MPLDSFRKYMSPDFQASSQPAMDWMPWDDQQQQGADLGSILGQLKPQGQTPAAGAQAHKAMDAASPLHGGLAPSKGGGKGSL